MIFLDFFNLFIFIVGGVEKYFMVLKNNQQVKPHRPPHLYLDGEIYFITARTFNKINYFKGEKKSLIKNSIKLAQNKYEFDLYCWTILENHYHLLIKIKKGRNLIDIVRFINGRSARLLVKEGVVRNGTPSRRAKTQLEAVSVRKGGPAIWYQYWDRIIKNEEEFYYCFSYIHNNPIKHGLVENWTGLIRYKFCSCEFWLNKMGEAWLAEILSLSKARDRLVRLDDV